MPETPNPSTEELMEMDSLVNGDIGAAQDEVVRRLQMLLNGAITAKNTQRGWTGNKAIPLIKKPKDDIDIAPSVLSEGHIGKILVGVSVDTSPQGIGGVFRNEAQIVIYSVEARINTSHQVRANWKLAEAIRLCLFPFLTGCVNAQNERVWRTLEPTGYSMLPGDWAEEFSGTQCTFRLVQSPNLN
jgi:hypothetical protein